MAIVDASGIASGLGAALGNATVYYYSPAAIAASLSGASGDLVELVAPKLDSAVALDANTVRLSFSEGMKNNAALISPSSYSITPNTIDGAIVAILLVTPESVAYPTYVDLSTTEMTDGKSYRAFVDGVEDTSGNPIDPVFDTQDYVGIGLMPQLVSITTVSSTKVRFTFSEMMLKNSALSSVSNYALLPLTPGAAPLHFTAIELPEDTSPTYVDITVSEMTDGASYQGGVITPSMSDKALNPVDPGFSTATFTGLGIPPTVSEVVPISANRVDVVFTEAMQDNADIRNATKYTWDNGLVTLSVLDVVGATVSLVTADQAPGTLYTLSVTP